MGYIFLAAAAVVWGGAFVAGRLLVAGADPLAVAWARFVLASLAFLVLGQLRRQAGRPAEPGAGPPWHGYALLGLSGIFGYNLFFFYGLARTTATESSLIIASSPVVVTLLGLVFLREALSWRKGTALAVSTAGVILIVLGAASTGSPEEAGSRLLGDLLMLGGVLCWSIYSFLGKRVLRQVSPFTATSRAVFWGTLFLTVPLLCRGGAGVTALAGWRQLLGLGYLSLVSTVFAFVAWYQGLAMTEVSRAAVFLNLVPLSTLAIAGVALGERTTWIQLLGGVLVLGGVWLVTGAGVPRRQERHLAAGDRPPGTR